MNLVDFVWNAMSGGAFYDGVKFILGTSFDKLKSLFETNSKDDFVSHLETIFSVNEEIKKQLSELKQNGEININSKNKITQIGDNNNVNFG